MVHGGGHHHGSSGGGSYGSSSNNGGSSFFCGWSSSPNRGGNRRHHHRRHQYQYVPPATNVVVVNQGRSWYNNTPLWWNSMRPQRWQRHDSFSTANSMYSSEIDDGCERGCERCCERCCCCLCTCLLCSIPSRSDDSPRGTVAVNEPTRPGKPNLLCPGLLISIILFAVLASISSIPKSNWTLNNGETRMLSIPVFNNAVKVSGNGAAGFQVYKFRKCPPLTGPKVTLEDTTSFRLAKDGYQYDYFYLNAGSVVQLDIVQSSGSTNVFLLRGQAMLDRIVGDADDDEEGGFGRNALLKKFVTAGEDPGKLDMSYNVSDSDIYILVYDNASTAAGDLSVHYKLDITTHNVNGKDPVCSRDSGPCVIARSKRKTCIIVQSAGDGDHTADDTVTIDIQGNRRWRLVITLSLTPVLLQILIVFCCCRGNATSYRPVADADRPPATAPGYHNERPTAPASSVAQAYAVSSNGSQQETIPVVPLENVVPVPAPSATKLSS